MEKYGFLRENFRVHKTKPHLILPPPSLVRISYILETYFAEVCTYYCVVLGWQILEDGPTYRPFLDYGSCCIDYAMDNARSVETRGGLAYAAKSGF